MNTPTFARVMRTLFFIGGACALTASAWGQGISDPTRPPAALSAGASAESGAAPAPELAPPPEPEKPQPKPAAAKKPPAPAKSDPHSADLSKRKPR